MKLLTLRRGYRETDGTRRTGYDYTYGTGSTFENAFCAALRGEFQRAPEVTPTGRGWVEVDVRLVDKDTAEAQDD